MFIGHYGVAFGARAVDKRVPLWAYFLAVQWVDILWCALVLAGVERVRIEPGVNPSSPLVFDYYPYTHSLAAGLVWALAAYIFYRLVTRGRGARSAGVLLALAVLSHWLLDFIVHLPDLDLVSESYKVGLGLWSQPLIEAALEAVLVGAELALYLKRSPDLALGRRIGLIVLCLGIGAVQIAGSFGPPPPSVRAVTLSGLAIYLLAAVLARVAEGPSR